MTFKELESFLDLICYSYNGHNFWGKYDVPSELKYEFFDYHEETELTLYVEYTATKDKLILLRRRFFGNASTLEKHEREESFKYVMHSVLRLLLFGDGPLDIKNILAGTVNINWLHKDLPEVVPANRIIRFKPTAE